MANGTADSECIFCLIANEEDQEAEVIDKCKELVCFKDIYPAAPHHYLVVPRNHIISCHSLNSGHAELVKKMVQMGKRVLHARGVTDMEDISLGFHKPPYTSVDHLHLHVLAPKSQISTHLTHKFIPDSHRFITASHAVHPHHHLLLQRWSSFSSRLLQHIQEHP